MVIVLIMVLIGLQLVDIVCGLGLFLGNSWRWWHVGCPLVVGGLVGGKRVDACWMGGGISFNS